MGKVGKKLKRKSLEAQGKWSDTMSQLEETLGGLRIIKAFIAEDKMVDRFKQCSDELRDATNKVAIRQSLAHPMSEFLGTLLIVLAGNYLPGFTGMHGTVYPRRLTRAIRRIPPKMMTRVRAVSTPPNTV